MLGCTAGPVHHPTWSFVKLVHLAKWLYSTKVSEVLFQAYFFGNLHVHQSFLKRKNVVYMLALLVTEISLIGFGIIPLMDFP